VNFRRFFRFNHHGAMSNLLQTVNWRVTESASILAFEKTGDASWPAWDRFLTVDGKRAYHLGNICGTCRFFFERLDGANMAVDVASLTGRLAAGVTALDNELVEALGLLMPVSEYRVALLRLWPDAVSLGSRSDYFAAEQVENEGISSFWGLPHYPKVPYYRPKERWKIDVGEGGARLFDFVVPMFPETWLKNDRINAYVTALAAGGEPTALSLSVLDVKEPAEGGVAHWCMAHYIVDGHHKVAAAARARKPITLIAFIALDHGISSETEVETALRTY
jgi:hypothetical protein